MDLKLNTYEFGSTIETLICIICSPLIAVSPKSVISLPLYINYFTNLQIT